MKSKSYLLTALLLATVFSPLYAQKLTVHNFRPQRDSVQTKSIYTYNIGSEADLYLLLSPAEPLLATLKKLAPQLSVDEALAQGNYNFEFLLDGESVYSEHLHPGAILKEDKLIARPLDIVLISNTRSGLWSMNLWDRFMSKAGLKLIGKKTKDLRIRISTYVDDHGIKYGPLIAEARLSVTRIPKYIDPSTMGPQPIAPGSGFELSKIALNKSLITTLNTRIADHTYPKINAIVVLHKGKLVLEQYYNGENRASLHDPRSVSKSITSTLVGMAIHDGFVKSENATLREFYNLNQYNNYSDKKADVRIIDLLSMSAAFDGNDDVDRSPGNEENMYPTADYTKFTLDLPMDPSRTNGKTWSYFTAGTNLVMDILDQRIPGGVEAYATKRLFKPLGIANFEWARTPQGKPFGGGGLKLRALDFAKYGLLYADGGMYHGQRILDKAWVEKSLSPLQKLPPDRPGYYGLLFWNKVFNVKHKSYQAYYASGNGGNKIYIFKELSLVIVVTASAYGKSYAHTQADEIVETLLLPAVLGR